uniref:Potassium channel domain-containing protein n=1 Tax=Stomoxys calcitrans TaxID=35570 RepID=A0A1I8NSM8_STOCA
MDREIREDPGSSSSSHIRRRRRIGRSMREKTPEASRRRRSSEDESSLVDASEPTEAHAVSMQIRPPQRALSAHESKILRRRDKTFASAAARSLSQPREAEKLSEPEASELIRTVKRSLSSPRNKDLESSEAENMSRNLSPESRPIRRAPPPPQPVQSTADENLSRLEQNLRRFEEERKRFESEKRLFEREKRDHKLRYKQMVDNEERKRLVQSYRKLSDRIKLPQDAEERKRLLHSLRLEKNEVALPAARTGQRRNRHSGNYEESSTQFSSSEAEMVEEPVRMSPARKQNNNTLATASVRGPPPQPPARKSVSRNNSLSPVRTPLINRNNSLSPVRPSNSPNHSISPTKPTATTVSRNNSLSPVRSTKVSRNNSLSPIRPDRRSKTPDERAQLGRKISLREHKEREIEARQETTATEVESDKEQKLRHRKPRRAGSVRREDGQRKHSLDAERKPNLESHDRVDSSSGSGNIAPAPEIVVVSKINQQILQVEKQDKESITTIAKEQKPSFLQRFFGRFRKAKTVKQASSEELNKEKEELLTPPCAETTTKEAELPDKLLSFAFLKAFLGDAREQWRIMKSQHPAQLKEISKLRNKCFAHTVVLILLVGFGGLMFRYTEGASEDIYKCEVRKVKRDFVDHLWSNSHRMREEDWKTLARQKLRKFEEELHAMGAMGIRYFPGQRSWNFVNCILYCWTVITTIGYGHITPKTTLGQSLTIAYAIIGIPIFLILLADFGKLFTRIIKFMWGYVRRLYYTGTCRKIRKQQQLRDAMNGVSMVYDAAIRRPSQFFGITAESDVESQMSDINRSSHPETPTSPYPETIVVDDEFNLPISLASLLLITYILLGAFVYHLWEDWTYMESFYFVFISMSTIGFGDLVPDHPIFMMCSIIYLVFGLALTSMFINVVQIKLSDTFKDASAKIGATIGFGVPSELGEEELQTAKTPSDLASVHGSRLGKIDEADNEHSPPPRPLTSILRTNRPNSPEGLDDETIEVEVAPPPLLPRRQVSVESPEPPADKKKKRRFFK